jgi:hypothetical protein
MSSTYAYYSAVFIDQLEQINSKVELIETEPHLEVFKLDTTGKWSDFRKTSEIF